MMGMKLSAVFPQLQKMERAVGDEILLSFEAGSNWSLTSSALWCTFLVNGEQNYSCSGIAGKQAVTIKGIVMIIDEELTADLTLLMDGNRQVIFEISRICNRIRTKGIQRRSECGVFIGSSLCAGLSGNRNVCGE